ncbi:hypothetical protein TWF718_005752 [Orbilia javanica]|uniref:Mid2 domain-containing protein n=1 Tax=Orbilia javanica TaxID=47235 RepID=A0AAN8MZF4_9PEZI
MFGVVSPIPIFSAILVFIISLATSQQTDTLNELGTLYPSTPPPDCSSFSARSSGLIQFGDTRTIRSTDFNQGCHQLSRTSCCPRNFGFRGFYSPASGCPPGYTSHATLTFSARRYIGLTYELSEKRGDICCPSVVDPVTRYEYTPGLYYCNAAPIRVASGPETFESYYGASAIVVVTEAGRPEATPAQTSRATSETPSSATVRGGSDREIPSQTDSASGTGPTSQGPAPSGPLRSGDIGNDSQLMGDGNKKGLSTGAKIGIAVGVAVPVLILAICAVYMLGRRSGKASAPQIVDTPGYGGEEKGAYVGGIQSDIKT